MYNEASYLAANTLKKYPDNETNLQNLIPIPRKYSKAGNFGELSQAGVDLKQALIKQQKVI